MSSSRFSAHPFSFVLNIHKDTHPTASLCPVFDHHHGWVFSQYLLFGFCLSQLGPALLVLFLGFSWKLLLLVFFLCTSKLNVTSKDQEDTWPQLLSTLLQGGLSSRSPLGFPLSRWTIPAPSPSRCSWQSVVSSTAGPCLLIQPGWLQGSYSAQAGLFLY